MEKRFILTELIQLYRRLPCLWDVSTEGYKDIDQRSAAWEVMLEKYKELDPDACVAAVKKKIDNLRTAYKREAKKVMDSKKQAAYSTRDAVYRPNLWYYEMMTFLNNKEEHLQCGIDPLTLTRDTSDDVSDHEERIEKRRHEEWVGKERHEERIEKRRHEEWIETTREPTLRRKKHKLVDTVNELLKQRPKKGNSFGLYVGEQLECMPTLQRHIAEKLIAEIIFLAKTENLNFDSRVETPSNSCSFSTHPSSRKTSSQCSPPPQFIKSSPPYQYNISDTPPSPCHSFSHETVSTPSSPHLQAVQFTPRIQPLTSSLQIQTQPTIKLPLSPQYLSSDSALFSPQKQQPATSSQNHIPSTTIIQNSISLPSSSKIIQGSKNITPNTTEIEPSDGVPSKDHLESNEIQTSPSHRIN